MSPDSQNHNLIPITTRSTPRFTIFRPWYYRLALFVAWFVVYLLLLVNAVAGGPGSSARFLEWSATPWVLTLNVVSFLFIVLHAITFFVAAPQAMAVHIGRRRVPGYLVLAGHYVAWATASVFVSWLLLGGR